MALQLYETTLNIVQNHRNHSKRMKKSSQKNQNIIKKSNMLGVENVMKIEVSEFVRVVLEMIFWAFEDVLEPSGVFLRKSMFVDIYHL